MKSITVFRWMLFLCIIPASPCFASITVKVTDTSGSPASSASVIFTSESNPGLTYRASTDPGGLCSFDFLKVAVGENTPVPFVLGQNYPNPFNPGTLIPFSLSEDGLVKLVIYNALGQVVRTLVNGQFSAGPHTVAWDGRDDCGFGVVRRDSPRSY